ncbi:hypothetical protein PIB30_105287, partial [Stylosanthes scabra]|nr:hypothetical protein [Stylosanthes scabra]
FQDLDVDEQIELLILASDGLWDVVPNDDAVALACTEEEPEAAARKLTEAAFSRGSVDNITCIVVRFHHDKVEPISRDKVDAIISDKVDVIVPKKADIVVPDKAKATSASVKEEEST